jgi:predicted dehydrogenase
MEKLNWGIIGLGRIADSFSNGFFDAKNANLIAVASGDNKKLQKYKELFNLENKFLFNNYDDLIKCKDVDIIYLALPNNLHYYWALKIIENNKNILLEKPATLSVLEALSISKNLEGKDLFFTEAFMYRYLPQIKVLIDIIKSQELGKIFSMESSFGTNLLTKKKFFFINKKKKINIDDRKFKKELGGGSIYDLGCYTTSFSLLINSILNKNTKNNFIISDIIREIGETGVDINSSAKLNFENKLISYIKCSFKKNLGSQTIIRGEKGEIILPDTWKGQDIIIEFKNKKKKIINFENKKNIYTYQIEQISSNLLNGVTKSLFPVMDISETISNIKVIEGWLNNSEKNEAH